MRLIDAENIISVCEILSEKGGDTHYWGQLISIINDMPTIPAIPVEWLDEKFMDMQNKDKALSRAAWLVLHAWQKEQEAR